MHRKVIETWDALWAAGAKRGGTHWNYSRGMVRFRSVQKKPAALGTEAYIDSEAPVRVRFYSWQDGDGFIERFRSEVLFQPPPVEEMALPPDFEHWDPGRKRRHLDTVIQKLSSRRYPEEVAAIVRSLMRALEIVRAQLSAKAMPQAEARAVLPQPTATRQTPQPAAETPQKSSQPIAAQQKHSFSTERRPELSPETERRPKHPPTVETLAKSLRPTAAQQKPSLAAETQRKNPPPPTGPQSAAPAQPGQIKDFWDFIAHPLAEERLAAVALLLTRDKDVAQNITQAVKRLPLLKALGLLPFK